MVFSTPVTPPPLYVFDSGVENSRGERPLPLHLLAAAYRRRRIMDVVFEQDRALKAQKLKDVALAMPQLRGRDKGGSPKKAATKKVSPKKEGGGGGGIVNERRVGI
jgi:hypothetical protein